jgi:hypothetical protein
MMPTNVIHVGDGFWNIRGSLKIGRLLDVGTQSSLVRRRSGKYLLLDACKLDPDTRRWIDEETSGGEAIEAVLHLHPFHTLSARSLHDIYPHAKLYGTARHHRRFPDLPWQTEKTEQAALHELFADDLDFSVPRGVDFIPSNARLHFASVLAFHRESRTLHVDDTLNYVRMPAFLRPWKEDLFGFHPSLPRVLERRSGAVKDFRDWAAELVERCRSVDTLCAAHTRVLSAREGSGLSISARVEAALHRVERRLVAHARMHEAHS